MAVTLPRLDRLPQQETPSIGRTDLNIPDATPAMRLQSEALVKGVTNVAESYQAAQVQYQKAVKDAMDTKTNEIINNFEVATNNMLSGPNGAKYQEGDPVPVYQKLDGDVKALRESITRDYEHLPEEARRMLDAKLLDSEQKFRIKSDVAYGNQYNQYETKVTDDTVTILKNQLVEDAGTIDPEDPRTFQFFESTVGKIMQARANSAQKKGLVGPDGKMHLSTAAAISKDLSDGIYNSIEGLNAKNYPEVAQKLRDQYKQYLDPVNLRKADESIEKASVEKRAQEAYIALSTLPEEQAAKELEKYKKDPKVQARAGQLLNDQKVREKRLVDMASDNAYSNAFDLVSDKMNSANPYVSINEMESDPNMRYILPKITKPDQRKALQSLISRPKESNTDTLVEMFQLNKTGQLRGMSAKEFVEKSRKLNRDDYLRFRNAYDTVNKPKTDQISESEERSRVKYMNDKLEESARLYNVVPKKGKPESWSAKEKQHYNNMMQGFMDYYESLPPKMSVPEQEKKVKEYLIQFMNQNPSPDTGWFGWGGREYIMPNQNPRNVVTQPAKKAAADQPAPLMNTQPLSTSSDLDTMSAPQVKQWMDRYQIENGRPADDTELLQQYINSKGGKL